MSPVAKALITGGAGFIGSYLAEALLREGYSVSIVDNFDPYYSPCSKRANLTEIGKVGSFTLHEVDIRGLETLGEVFSAERPEIVVHLAAMAGVRPSIQKPKLYEQVNVAGTLNLLELARIHKVRKFIFGSSSSVYGTNASVPFSENELQLKPVSPYAATKLAGELLCYTYSHLHRLPVVCLRFFTVYGPRQRPDLAICKFASLIGEGKVVPIFGDGSSRRDYTYVDDIVQGLLAAVAYETQFDVFNLGNSHTITLLEMVKMLEKIIGKPAILNYLPPQAGDVPLTWANISKARKHLNYEPCTQIADGLRRFWEWYSKSVLPSCSGKRDAVLHESSPQENVERTIAF